MALKSSTSARIRPDRPAEAIRPRQLAREHLVCSTPVGEPGQAVQHRLLFDDAVQARVLQRHDGLADQRRCGDPLLRVEGVPEEDEPTEATAPRVELELDLLGAGGVIARLDRRAVLGDQVTAVGVRRPDCGFEDHVRQLLRVESGRKRLAEADIRLPEAPPLRLEIDLADLEVGRQLQIGAFERRELVALRHGRAPEQTVRAARQACS